MKKTMLLVLVVVSALFVASSALFVSALQGRLINEAEARAVALGSVDGVVNEVEFENGMYEVEVVRDGAEHEVVIDSETGKILHTEEELTEPVKSRVGENEAIVLARKYASGSLDEVEMERVDGKLVYAVSFVDGDVETEVLIDVESGEMVEVQVEYGDDD